MLYRDTPNHKKIYKLGFQNMLICLTSIFCDLVFLYPRCLSLSAELWMFSCDVEFSAHVFSQMAREDRRKGVSFASELRKLTGRSRSVTVNPCSPSTQDATHSKEEKVACPGMMSLRELTEWRRVCCVCVCSTAAVAGINTNYTHNLPSHYIVCKSITLAFLIGLESTYTLLIVYSTSCHSNWKHSFQLYKPSHTSDISNVCCQILYR